MMAHWCKLADLPKGLTLHGLQKSLGVYLAEAEASTRQLMDVLCHDDIDHAEFYSREASQVRLAVRGMDRGVRLVTRESMLGEPIGKPRGEPPYKALCRDPTEAIQLTCCFSKIRHTLAIQPTKEMRFVPMKCDSHRG